MPESDLNRAHRPTTTIAGVLPVSARFVVAGLEPPAGDAPGPDPIVVSAFAVPWNVTGTLNWWGDTYELEAGAIAPENPARVKFLLDHGDTAFGFGAAFADDGAGLTATMHVPRAELENPEVARAVRQMANGVRDAVSIGARILEATEEPNPEDPWVSHYRVHKAELVELSSVVLPMFSAARVSDIAAHRATRGATMPTPRPTVPVRANGRADDDDAPDDDDPGTDDDDEGAAGQADQETARAELHRRATTRARAQLPAPGRYPTFGHFALEAAQGRVPEPYLERIQAAWTDELTSDVPGLIPENWVREVVDLMGTVSGTVDLFSSRPLPDSGNTFHVPVLTQGPDVGLQPGEKQEIPSRKVLIGDMPVTLATYAGGQDVALQVILRSDPSYLDELMRLYVREMALQINMAAGTALIAGATVTSPLSAADINGSIIDAAVILGQATFSFPQVFLMGANVWAAIGKATDDAGRPLFPTYSPMNPVGSFNLTDGAGTVRDLGWAVDWSIDPNTAILGLRDAFRTWRGPMQTLTADVPRLIGRDVAVFEFVAMGVMDARGLVKMTLGATGTSAAAKKSAS